MKFGGFAGIRHVRVLGGILMGVGGFIENDVLAMRLLGFLGKLNSPRIARYNNHPSLLFRLVCSYSSSGEISAQMHFHDL